MKEKNGELNRNPPASVRRQLRKEVGFGCPIKDCGNPYLSWHHFDPPWSERHHHNPEGMIALCAEHHNKADNGAYTKKQLRKLKLLGTMQNKKIIGRFDWMRNHILAVVGGLVFYDQNILFKFNGRPLIWYNRDENGYMLLNVSMLKESGEPQVIVKDNYWCTNNYPPVDIESPPSGKLLNIKYKNGDNLKIQFREFKNKQELKRKFPHVDVHNNCWDNRVIFPITVVEIFGKMLGGELIFTPKKFKHRKATIAGKFMVGNDIKIRLY
ncbi:hypothetical protein [Methanobacterium sp.]|uniref:hypothetical protein n=1 Tax=Methanobacterium sp. TaxID=2164 RepID=UPI0025EA69F3|nr:hypothetical protein [Methanobacterium sp.]MBI5458929.1 HNH endonuclease [Methanobacterium sp.]